MANMQSTDQLLHARFCGWNSMRKGTRKPAPFQNKYWPPALSLPTTKYSRSWQLNGTLVVSLYRPIFYEKSHNTEGNWKNSNTFKNLNSQHPKKKNLYRQFDGSWTNRNIFTVQNPKYHKSCPPAKTLDTSVPNNPSNFLRTSRCVINMSSYEASVILLLLLLYCR